MHKNSLNNLKPQDRKWSNYPTNTIRIPEIFKEELLTFARQLDNGIKPIDSSVTEKIKELLSKIDNQESGYKTISKQIYSDLKKLL